MEQTFDKLNAMLEKELDEIVKKGVIAPEHLNLIDKVVDIMKDVKEICNMDEMDSGYSQRGYSRTYYDNGNSYRNGNSYGGRYSRRGGRRHDDREEILDRLDYLMENSGTEQERQAIRQALNTLENM